MGWNPWFHPTRNHGFQLVFAPNNSFWCKDGLAHFARMTSIVGHLSLLAAVSRAYRIIPLLNFFLYLYMCSLHAFSGYFYRVRLPRWCYLPSSPWHPKSFHSAESSKIGLELNISKCEIICLEESARQTGSTTRLDFHEPLPQDTVLFILLYFILK